MVASTDIKFYVHTNTNAPQLTNNFGCMIGVLDACLVNGLTLSAVSSMTITGTTVTVNFGSAHNLLRFQVVKISGATQAEYNGEHRILSVPTTSSITFDVATAPSASPATGTIVASLPPLGWTLPFTGTGKRAYKNTDIDGPYLRVVDGLDPAWTSTFAKYAKVGMVAAMTDIDTMTGHQVPYDPAAPNKNWVGTGSSYDAYNGWAKWFYAINQPENNQNANKYNPPDNGTRTWVLVGDGTTFYILNKLNPSSNAGYHVPHGFGKLNNLSPVNANAYFLAATDDYSIASTSQLMTSPSLVSTNTSYGAKSFMFSNYKGELVYNATANAMTFANSGDLNCGSSGIFSGASAYVPVFNNEYILVDRSGGGVYPRGIVPIMRWLPQPMPYAHLQTVIDGADINLAVNIIATQSAGQVLFNLGQL